MRKTFIPIGLGMLIALGALLPQKSSAQDSKKKPGVAVVDTTEVIKKEVKNRNVMLNAQDQSAGPRTVNIGLPFADFLLLENDLPVTYNYFPHIPLYSWKYDSSLGRMGLLSFAESALTWGKVGLCVSSFDRSPSNKFKGFFTVYTNNFGSINYSASISGPIGKKGWGYVLGLNETYDHGSGTHRGYTPFNDRTEIIKGGITKKYDKGDIKLLYKHASSLLFLTNNYPLIDEGNGNYKPVPGFNPGSDSYYLGSGMFPYFDAQTGQSKMLDARNDNMKAVTDQVYLMGNHDFGNGYKLSYNSTYETSLSPYNAQVPISLQVLDPSQQTASGMQFNLHGQSDAYTGPAQLMSSYIVNPTRVNESFTHFALTKKFGDHALRVGLTHQYYYNKGQYSNYGVYYQTVEPQPRLLDAYVPVLATYGMNPKITDANGLLPTAMSTYQKTVTNKFAFYFSDDAKLTRWLSAGIGGRIEREDDKDTHSQYINQFILGRPMMEATFNNKWNHVAEGNFVAKVTKEFGFLGDITYNDWFNYYYDVPEADKTYGAPNPGSLTTVEKTNQIQVMNYGAGIYWNHGDLISLVSKVTKITKNNYTTTASVFNPADPSQSITVNPVLYDISTIGWTTDIVSKPFKNFNIHYLLTLQNPQYKNYNIKAFGQTYNYNSMGVPGISKVLMEIDPSYQLGKLNFWFSLRYFGKQYGNLANSFSYNPWWENFAGINYNLSSKCDLKLSVVNFLDQKGISGVLQGADQINNSTPFVGHIIDAGAIRPRTIELTATFKL